MVKEGKLRAVRSLLDSDFQDENCCVLAMNRWGLHTGGSYQIHYSISMNASIRVDS